jgi:hypothetical protein
MSTSKLPIVYIGANYSYREDALRQQLLERVVHLACLLLVVQAPDEAFDPSIAPLGGLQQDRSTIGGALPLIELQQPAQETFHHSTGHRFTGMARIA